MYWTPRYTRHTMKTNNIKHTTQYVLDTPIHKTHDEDKQKEEKNTQYVLVTTIDKDKTKDTPQYVLDTTIFKQTHIT